MMEAYIARLSGNSSGRDDQSTEAKEASGTREPVREVYLCIHAACKDTGIGRRSSTVAGGSTD
jgi:hypothetical protein